jgi:hypothetical protein
MSTREQKESKYRLYYIGKQIYVDDNNYYKCVDLSYISDSKMGEHGYLRLMLQGYGVYTIYPGEYKRPNIIHYRQAIKWN